MRAKWKKIINKKLFRLHLGIVAHCQANMENVHLSSSFSSFVSAIFSFLIRMETYDELLSDEWWLTLLELFATEFCELLEIRHLPVPARDQRPDHIVPNRTANLFFFLFGFFNLWTRLIRRLYSNSPKCDAISTPMFKYVNSVSRSNFRVDVDLL